LGRLIEKFRYLSYIAIVSLLLATLAALGWGMAKTIAVVLNIARSWGQDPYTAVRLIELMDVH
jgi:hypothetical protein